MPPTLYIIYYNIYYVFTTVAGSASVYTNITVDDMLYIYSYYCSYVYACRVVFNAGHAQLTSVL